jgi:hypothetical protein
MDALPKLRLPIELLAQIQNIPVSKEIKCLLANPVIQQEISDKCQNLANSSLLNGSITLEDMKSDTRPRRNLTQNLADTITMDIVAPLMVEPLTQQQMFVMSQILKFPDQMHEIIKAAMAAGIKSPIIKEL